MESIEEVVWKFAKGSVSIKEIEEAEKKLNVIFPDQLKRLYQTRNGGGPRPNHMETLFGREVRLRYFLPIGETYKDNLVEVNKKMKKLLPDNYLAVANDDFGNYFCMDLKMSGSFRLFFWDHESKELDMVKITYTKRLKQIVQN
ncbi:SMI1/KNR4 family protein [Salipaludibacillus aurantiacus]|uniref:SMI1-KNR4 cell-wall n=1 Tax=Salipaludibacillus aurantiacus TaxID=1601833 RepID=A0A1H9UFC8_9BACI|nr:SMI1/KNR4 family protein [Salipaludibacillus aurantiacus]SES08072.1 SMI1-KNR4 cell-wall [Salipaludibacillus aurantiacus]